MLELLACWYQDARHLIPGTWHLAPGARYQVAGGWHQVPGTRCEQQGTWHQVPCSRCLVQSIWYRAPGTKHRHIWEFGYPNSKQIGDKKGPTSFFLIIYSVYTIYTYERAPFECSFRWGGEVGVNLTPSPPPYSPLVPSVGRGRVITQLPSPPPSPQ